jgi:hypothetical protein
MGRYSLLIYYISFAVLFLGCQAGNVDLDNAGTEDLTVLIDGQPYEMKAGAYRSIHLERGKHELEIRSASGELKKETSFSVDIGGLINLGETRYYIWTDLYGENELRRTKLKEEWTQIGDKRLYGDFTVIESDQNWVERRWDYGLNEEFPEDLLGWKPTNEKYIIKSKLFRQEDLLKTYQNRVESSKP